MLHPGWHYGKATGSHFVPGRFVELVTHAQVKRSGNHGNIFRGRMHVRRHFVAIRHLQANGERSFFARIASEDGHLCASWQARRPIAPGQIGRSQDFVFDRCGCFGSSLTRPRIFLLLRCDQECGRANDDAE